MHAYTVHCTPFGRAGSSLVKVKVQRGKIGHDGVVAQHDKIEVVLDIIVV